MHPSQAVALPNGLIARNAFLDCTAQRILNSAPGEKVEVSFEGVSVAAASFLDEFIARLAVSVGPEVFFSRVRFVHTNALISRSLQVVIDQRLAAD